MHRALALCQSKVLCFALTIQENSVTQVVDYQRCVVRETCDKENSLPQNKLEYE